jgi:hypothetical protein
MMRDTTNSLKRQLQQIARKVKVTSPDRISPDRLLRIIAGEVEPTPAEQAYLIDLHRQHELDYDPPDSIERKLARMIAKINGEPDPYGTDGLSEVERRAYDWADYRKKQGRGEELAQENRRLPFGLRELRASDTMNTSNREREQGQVA